MFVYVLLLMAATPQTVDKKPETPEPYKSCPNGSRVLISEPCSHREEPASLPIPPQPTTVVQHRMPNWRAVARPKNNPGTWVVTYDYPARSLANEEEGTTGFRLTVGPDGKVSWCSITSSSGSANLDAATCKNVTRRARFDPALDDNGNPTVGYYSNRVTWRIPEIPSYAQQIDLLPSGPQATYGVRIDIDEQDYPLEAREKGLKGAALVTLSISEKGNVTACTVITSTDSPLLDTRSCEIASRWTFLPARDVAGNSIAGETSHDIVWILPDAWKEYQRTGIYPPKSVE